MSNGSSGWRALEKPSAAATDSAPKFTPAFTRLARVQALSSAGDAMIAIALAGSLFFSIDPSDARWRVGLYLAFTVAPFAVVGPLIGPALDRARGGRRMMMILINIVRVIAALLMISNTDSLLLFPLAFILLVAGKSFAVAKAALVPTTVRHTDELIDTNSRLALLSGLAGFAGAVPAGIASFVVGPPGAVTMAMIAFAATTILAVQLPQTAVAAEPVDSTERLELRSSGIVLAGSAMGILRGIVGYMTFLVAFAFRGGADGVDLSGVGTAAGAGLRNALGFTVGSEGGVPAWKLGVVVAFSIIGMLVGSLVAPRLRRSTPEENILLGVLVLVVAVGLFSAWTGDLTAATFVALTVGLAASAGKLAFDSIVQRDAPDANYGRSFARFETRFQVIWVIGALMAVVIETPANIGFLVIAAAAGFAAVSYFFGSRASHDHPVVAEPDPTDLDGENLKPAYPQMNLREGAPAARRMPSGWGDGEAARVRVSVPVVDPDPTPADLDAADPTVVEPEAADATIVETPESQLPLWPDRS
ncbi:MAG: MFS transporter [Acidimicrobiia bacterium]|nr:MFS transporter [Acidimicrobiia bacterium]